MKISSIICTADILQTLSKITDSNLLQVAHIRKLNQVHK